MEDNKFICLFKGYRHSSYTPIKLIDPKYDDSLFQKLLGNQNARKQAIAQKRFERRKIARDCAMEMLTELTRQTNHQEQPVKISLCSLTLLSPIKGDNLFLPKGESEHRQLKESYDALKMLHGREMTVFIDEKPVKIIPDINIVNAPMNWHGVKLSQIRPSDLESDINTEGMNKFITDTEHALGIKDKLDEELITSLIDSLDKSRTIFSKKFDELDKLLDTPTFNDTKYIELINSIEKIKNNLYQVEHQILDRRLEILQKQDIDSIIKTIRDPDKQDTAKLYYQSLFMYRNNKIPPAQFGARYLLVNQRLGKNVDFYCKSGEDRTGRMQNLIEELCVFHHQHKHFPEFDYKNKTLDKTDQNKQTEIAKTVSERSVSRDNCNANSPGARGLQMTGSQTIYAGITHLSERAMGTLAKLAYDKNAIQKLWHKAHPRIANMTKAIKMTLFSRQENKPKPQAKIQLAPAIAEKITKIFMEFKNRFKPVIEHHDTEQYIENNKYITHIREKGTKALRQTLTLSEKGIVTESYHRVTDQFSNQQRAQTLVEAYIAVHNNDVPVVIHDADRDMLRLLVIEFGKHEFTVQGRPEMERSPLHERK